MRRMRMERVTVMDSDGNVRTMHVVAAKGEHVMIAEHSLRKGKRWIPEPDPTSYAEKEKARRRQDPRVRWDSDR